MKARAIIALILLAVLSVTALCVRQTSFVAHDGQRYYTISDDALISLRYAWNLAHGHGLVWNEGERLEGFTNPLWTLYAAGWAVCTSRRLLPLVMQCSGVALLLAQALVFLLIARALMRVRGRTSPWREVVAFVLPLAYGPLVYWALEGLEVCLVGFLMSLAVLFYVRRRLLAVAVTLGLAFWTRPDTAIPAAVIMGLAGLEAWRERSQFRVWLKACAVLVGFAGAIFIARELYYGHLWPNTYVLKMQDFSMKNRIKLNGLGYIRPFLHENALPLGLALVALVATWTRWRFLFAALVFPMIAYAVYVGGDALPYWRFIAPYVPFLGLALLDDGGAERPASSWRCAPTVIMVSVLLGAWLVTAVAPLREQFRGPQFCERANIETAIELNRLLKPGASIGVLHAGSIPYYTDFQAFDFLGKCDWYIARLPPDLEGPQWGGMHSVPGHNKHGLLTSLIAHKPTYIQSYVWDTDSACAYAYQHYAAVPTFIRTPFTDQCLFLARDSELVRWELLRPKPLLAAQTSAERVR